MFYNQNQVLLFIKYYLNVISFANKQFFVIQEFNLFYKLTK